MGLTFEKSKYTTKNFLTTYIVYNDKKMIKYKKSKSGEKYLVSLASLVNAIYLLYDQSCRNSQGHFRNCVVVF